MPIKYSGNALRSVVRGTRKAPFLLSLLSISLAALLAASAAQADGNSGQMIVNVDDVRGLFDLDTEWIRQDLLETAFHDAAKRKKWLGDYRFTYNNQLPTNPRNRLELRLLDWSRNRANFFEFSGGAVYYDADGKSHNLGIVYGVRTGIDITMRHDIGERFAEVAEDAFADALRKLKKIYSQSPSD